MDWLQYLYIKLSMFTDGVLSVVSYIWSILQSLWYSLTTILSGVGDLITQVFSSGIF